MRLLARLASQRARVAVSTASVSSKCTSANNTNGTRVWCARASKPLSVVRVSSLLVLWLWLYKVGGSTHWEAVGGSAIWTLTSGPRSLRCIPLLLVIDELFLLVYHHHLVEHLVVSSLFHQGRCSQLRVRLTFHKVSWASHLCFSILVRWGIGSHAASSSLYLHVLWSIWDVFWMRDLIGVSLVRKRVWVMTL